MWPYTQEENTWLAANADEPTLPRPADLTPERLSFYLRRGRQLRSQAAVGLLRRIGARLRRPFGRLRPARTPEDAAAVDVASRVAGGLRAPLTSIRSCAEILRDNPDIDPAQRRRFIEIVLAEEARLEALISQLLGASRIKRRPAVWQVRLQDLKLVRQHGSAC
ncbi:MAG: histidine kinase dimerization/phospho-acceptor domain-containing protein [Alphaproteobacteria bacterium]|nr:histidine kinase dimerization/phospho-acceptor domain-containing protein [Alphaproteobacteria bacterium]